MVWVRFDDQFPIHRKVSRLLDAAFRLHVSGIFWCARNLTNGVIPEEYLDEVCPRIKKPEQMLADLVRRGLWHEAGQGCPSKYCPAPVDDGWAIHDYLNYQPSKEKVDRQREANAERQRRWRERQEHAADQVGNGVTNGVTNGERSALVTHPRPVPTRPDPKESSSVRNAHANGPNDDDSIDLAIVQLLTELTGREVSISWATQVRQQILTGRTVRKSRMAYVVTAVRERPQDFLPPTRRLRAVPETCPVHALEKPCRGCAADKLAGEA